MLWGMQRMRETGAEGCTAFNTWWDGAQNKGTVEVICLCPCPSPKP